MFVLDRTLWNVFRSLWISSFIIGPLWKILALSGYRIKMSLIKLKIKLADIQWPSPFNSFFFYQSGHWMLVEPEIEVGWRWGRGGGGRDQIRTMTYCQLTYVWIYILVRPCDNLLVQGDLYMTVRDRGPIVTCTAFKNTNSWYQWCQQLLELQNCLGSTW